MLVPLTDSTNPYAAMMLELIRIQRTRPMDSGRAAHVAPTVRQRRGVRALVARFSTGHRRAAAGSAA